MCGGQGDRWDQGHWFVWTAVLLGKHQRSSVRTELALSQAAVSEQLLALPGFLWVKMGRGLQMGMCGRALISCYSE